MIKTRQKRSRTIIHLKKAKGKRNKKRSEQEECVEEEEGQNEQEESEEVEESAEHEEDQNQTSNNSSLSQEQLDDIDLLFAHEIISNAKLTFEEVRNTMKNSF